MNYEHCNIAIAKLKLRGRFSPEELDDAEAELWDKKVIEPCAAFVVVKGDDFESAPGHEACVRIADKAR